MVVLWNDIELSFYNTANLRVDFYEEYSIKAVSNELILYKFTSYKLTTKTENKIMTSKKKTYLAPELTVLGNVEQLTLEANLANSDTPDGVPNSAFPSKPQ